MGTVYLLHFIDAAGNHAKHGHAGHYVGFTENLPQRLATHRSGRGARLLQVVLEDGLSFVVVRLWTGVTEAEEQRVKNLGGAARCCPVCNPGTTAGSFAHVSKASRWEKTKGKKRRFLRKVRTRSVRDTLEACP